jgi:hypothetical protein
MSTTTAPLPPPSSPPRPDPVRQSVRALAVLIAVVAVAWTALSFVTLLARATASSAQTFTGVQSVSVDVAFESVTVTGDAAGTDRAALDRRWSWTLHRPTVSSSVRGGVLHVTSSCPWNVGRGCSGAVHLVVPQDVPVRVRSSDGAVTLQALHGPLDVATSDGAIHADGAVGTLALRTSDGSITSTGTRSGRVDASTSDGHVTLEFLAAPTRVRVHTSDGGVDVLVPRDGTLYRVTATTGDGGTDIGVPNSPDATRTIQVQTSDGSVRVGYTR